MKLLRAQRPNAGIRSAYLKKLRAELDKMFNDVAESLLNGFQDEEKEKEKVVQDAEFTPSWFAWAVSRLRGRWVLRWQEKAESIARWLVLRTQSESGSQYRAALKAAGLTVRFSPARMDGIVRDLIAENVSLIRSIPEEFFGQVEELVQESVLAGRDVATLREKLQERFSVADSRAKVISRDQSNKAFQAIKREENRQMGVTEGIWVHVPGTKSSRRTHMRMHGKRFKLDEGLYDSDVGKNVLPGSLPLCNCVWRAILPEFGD